MNTIKSRYEVGLEAVLLGSGECISFHAKIDDAFKAALQADFSANHTIDVVYVYDRMARIGKPQLWYVEMGNLIVKDTREA